MYKLRRRSIHPSLSLLYALSRVIGVSYQKGASLMRRNQVCIASANMREKHARHPRLRVAMRIRACAKLQTQVRVNFDARRLYDGQLRH
jgi:hypothetical protein